MQHTCHTRKGEEKSISGSPNAEQTHGLSLGLTAVLPGLGNSSPLKPWGPCGWEYGQPTELKCPPLVCSDLQSPLLPHIHPRHLLLVGALPLHL